MTNISFPTIRSLEFQLQIFRLYHTTTYLQPFPGMKHLNQARNEMKPSNEGKEGDRVQPITFEPPVTRRRVQPPSYRIVVSSLSLSLSLSLLVVNVSLLSDAIASPSQIGRLECLILCT